jgi:hypothetical protein
MNTRTYPWRTAFLCAVFETDPAKMLARIGKATTAIEVRLADHNQPDDAESRAIEDAWRGLATLKAEGDSVLADPKEAEDCTTAYVNAANEVPGFVLANLFSVELKS